VETHLLKIDEQAVTRQVERVKAYKTAQDRSVIDPLLEDVRRTARGTGNLLPVMKQAFLAGATLGQVAYALRDVFGEHRATL
jgi:methylmalonyl-CoA mutase N-terminal domain/subunit